MAEDKKQVARLNQPDVKKQQTGDETGSGQTGSADLKRVISGPDRMVVPCMTSRGLSSLAYQPEPQLGCQADFFFFFLPPQNSAARRDEALIDLQQVQFYRMETRTHK